MQFYVSYTYQGSNGLNLILKLFRIMGRKIGTRRNKGTASQQLGRLASKPLVSKNDETSLLKLI